ncbi:hypothetical protein [Vibrio algivorus]|uniref:Uncharacterized protein n=1 Tax=Vibrio algivorus TaxID=1667024 RepID=A0ABQ6EKB8_9VIBR|nr:hypothetical protein [Vibrio algivorus]GLT13553.1 hypothetical protein GCM10007931_05270 [Vibrio algivorus]
MNKKSAIAVALMLTGLTACNDSDSNTADNGGAESSSYSVTAIDGYLRGAQVWLDLNGNFKLDIGEPSANTGNGGKADLDTTGIDNPEQYSVIVQAIKGETVDEDTITDENPNGTAVEKAYVMSAPPGESAVTPLSTLVDILIKQSASDGDSAEQIEQKKQKAIATISSQLGLSEDELLGDFIEKGHTDMVYVSQNLVAANVFPESADGLEEAAKDTSNKNNFSKKAAAVNAFIKKKVAEIKQDPDKSFESEEPIFTQDSDVVTDSDGDDVADIFDAFPNDATEWVDTDEDSVGDNADAFPEDATETQDTDGDGVGDNADIFPEDAKEWLDTDKDGVGDNADAFPEDANETKDTDGDGVGDNLDAFPLDQFETTDSDNDGYGDNSDIFPNDKNEWFDTDGDGVGNNADAFPTDSTETADTDGDGVGDNSDISPLDKNYFVNLRSYDKQLTVVGATEQPVVEQGVMTTQANGDSVWVYLPMTQEQSLTDFPDVSFDATSDAQVFMNLYMLVVPDTDGMTEFETAAVNDSRHFKLKSYGPEGLDDPIKYVEIRLYQGESLNDLLVMNNIDKSKFIVPVYHDAPAGTGTDGDYEAKGNFFLRFGDSNYTGYDEITLNRFSFEPTYQLMEEGGKFVTSATQTDANVTILPYGNALVETNGDSVWMYSQIDQETPLEEFGDFLFSAHEENDANVSGGIFANIYVKPSSLDVVDKIEAQAVVSYSADIRNTQWGQGEGNIFVLTVDSGQSLSSLLKSKGLSLSDFIAIPYFDSLGFPATETEGKVGDGDPEARGNFFVRFGDSGYTDSQSIYLTRYGFNPVHQLTLDSAPFMTTAAVTNAAVEVKENAEVEITTGGDSVWAYTPIDREQPLTDFADFMFFAKDENGNDPAPNTFANVYLTSVPDLSEDKLNLLDALPSEPGAPVRKPKWSAMPDGRYVYVLTVPNQQLLRSVFKDTGLASSDFNVLPFYDAPEEFDGDVEAKGNFFVRIGGSSYTGNGDKVVLSHYSFEPFYMLSNSAPFFTTATQTGATISGYGNPDEISVTANGQSVWFYYLMPSSSSLSVFENFSFTMTSTGDSVSGGMFANVYLMPNNEEARIAFQQAVNEDGRHFQELAYGSEEGKYLKMNIFSDEVLGELLASQGLNSIDYTAVVYHDGYTDGDPEAKGNFFIRTGGSKYTGHDTFTLSFN